MHAGSTLFASTLLLCNSYAGSNLHTSWERLGVEKQSEHTSLCVNCYTSPEQGVNALRDGFI